MTGGRTRRRGRSLALALSLASGLAAAAMPRAAAPAEEAPRAAPAKAAAELPPAARAGTWRSGAKRPEPVPPAVVVRAATRKAPPNGATRADARPGGAADTAAIEIIWHAPNSAN